MTNPSGELGELSAVELSGLFRSGEASPVEAVTAALSRIERFNPDVNAFAHVTPEIALAAAREAERRYLKGEPLGDIDGLPITIKELTPVIGIPQRNGSALGSTSPARKEPLVVRRLRGAGAAILGTTTSPELGWKGVTHGPATGITRNPWRKDRAAGGSSGGAAVAAALNMGVLHDGSDGGGSIRIPASFCGVVGFKPTFGWIPPAAANPHFELGHRGPLGRHVEDTLLYFNAAAGGSTEAMLGYCPSEVPDWRPCLAEGVQGLRVGYSRTLGYGHVDPDVAATVDRAAERIAGLGAIVESVDGLFPDPHQAYLTLWWSAAANMIRKMALTPEQHAMLDPGLARVAEAGRQLTADDYIEARLVLGEVRRAMAEFHRNYDVLMLPTMPITAFEAGCDVPPSSGMAEWSEWSPFTYPFNMTSQPAISVPCGFDRAGLPVGLQLVGRAYRDDVVLRLAAAYQTAYPEPLPNRPSD
ncbi:amidase [Oceanibacterium hippocampi]|uniref:Acylamidase n=1 Tax=Oceanibacterium hippocampi TaxID=745714 RepID=A0A1Y5TLC4_9PROT|nr:amidase [Oceanibacterium hippocampi]SLN66615.1 Acylamidase [Oceanibacterium hippocampi]